MSTIEEPMLSSEELQALAIERDRPGVAVGAIERMLKRVELAIAVTGGGGEGSGAGAGDDDARGDGDACAEAGAEAGAGAGASAEAGARAGAGANAEAEASAGAGAEAGAGASAGAGANAEAGAGANAEAEASAVASAGAEAGAGAGAGVKTIAFVGVTKGVALFVAGILVGGAGVKLAATRASGVSDGPRESVVSGLTSAEGGRSVTGESGVDVHSLPPLAGAEGRTMSSATAPSSTRPMGAMASSTLGAAPTLPAGRAGAAGSSRSDIIAESQMIDGVRMALGRQDPKSALTLLDQIDVKYSKGGLREEAASLRIRALRMAGRNEEADARAGEFRRRFPNSLFAD